MYTVFPVSQMQQISLNKFGDWSGALELKVNVADNGSVQTLI